MPTINSQRYLSLKQGGFLLPLALVLILFGGGLALALLVELPQAKENQLLSTVGSKSSMAAESAAQLFASRLFFPNTSPPLDRRQVDSRCQTLPRFSTLDVEGLRQCVFIVSCECRYDNNAICDTGNISFYNGSAGINQSFYRIQSEARCGTGEYQGNARKELIKRIAD